MKKINLLLLARPDHSYSIYEALNKQNKISFLYGTFGLFDKRLSFLHYRKARYTDGNARIFKFFTVLHTLHFKLGWIKEFDETKIFTKYSRRLLKLYRPDIIHYWPNYCYKAVDEYKTSHPETKTIADVYMPNPIFACKIMESAYARYGLTFNNEYLKSYALEIAGRFAGADYIAVPSKFVELTFRDMFPDKHFICNSYGFKKCENYIKRKVPQVVKNFIYVGQVSLEKGVDILLSFFACHKEFHLDLFGNISLAQREIIYIPFQNCNNIVFHGAVSKQQLREAFKKADVGLHMSRFDAYSLAVSEQIGSGLPVIVSENTGISSEVEYYHVGLVAKIDDGGDSFAHCINQMCDINNYTGYLNSVEKVLFSSSLTNSYTNQVIKNYWKILCNESITD